ncbi:MFS transporter [Lacihabitans sp. CS3-21]|jgi:MFS transporter, UMF1 family|uniref:MFS transporter n=1 Tax=Lacihabitans sp. CS3-21 TaxID=2487332 RepID=UPI0020CBC1FF|nr:MFS transporter [Lacihabitans sp. CS3-21]MCP9747350.1 MFS transporter [Lacihabitans sp. CS3-21]
MNFINNKKIWNAWSMYDWANSVHNLVITTVIFPIYYHATAVGIDGSDKVLFFGFEVNNNSLYSFTISAAAMTLVFLSPILTSIADYSGRRKMFMKFFCYLGAASCAYFYFFTKESLNSVMIAFGLSIVGWGGSIVFYNSYIPQIATEDNFDKLSAKGFVFGYIGSVILLVFNLLMILKPELFGLTEADSKSGLTSRIAFLTVGIWWFGFAQIPFYFLPKDNSKKFELNWIKKGIKELRNVILEVRQNKILTKFLTAYFTYYLGVMTVIYVATLFAEDELKIPRDGLIATLLVIQLVAIPGSYLASYLSRKFGNSIALRIQVFIWFLVPLGAYFTTTATQFYVIAGMVGLVMGGIQSLSRSTFAKLIPEDIKHTASYFSLYDILEKASITTGTFIFGYLNAITGSMRTSILFLMVAFFLGFLLLMRIPSKTVYHDK